MSQSTPQKTGETLLSVLSDGVIGVDRKGLINFFNKSATRLTGWTHKQAIGKPVSDVFRLQDETSQQLDLETIRQILTSQESIGPITRQRLRNKQGGNLLIDYSISPLDKHNIILMFHDLSHTQDTPSKTLLYQVSYDPLTRLPNRDALQQTLSHIHDDFINASGTYSLLLLDLDRFKLINDSYGHKTGDRLLQSVAERMQQSIRERDNLGRWGGEEFLCILPDADMKTALEIAERMRTSMAKESFTIDDREIFITTSIGIAHYPDDGDTIDDLLRVADATLYEAKRSGRDRVLSSKELSGSIFSIGTQLEQALNEHRVAVAYQPIIDITTGLQVGEEALARIYTDKQQYIDAGQFIDAAIQLQLIHRIDYEVIRSAIMRCSTDVMEGGKPMPHFVNVSADLLRHPELIKQILELALTQCTACGELLGDEKPLVIEITEQEFLRDVKEVERILKPFLDFGLRLAIDDFGSGYSSLTYLADLPVSFLKIEGDLIKRISTEPRVLKIIEGVQDLANKLDLITIAEHIEDQATMDILADIGVNWGQGYFAARPEIH